MKSNIIYTLTNNDLNILSVDTKHYIVDDAGLAKYIDVKSYQNSILTHLHLIMPELAKQFVIN